MAKSKPSVTSSLPYILIVAGIIGLISALIISIDKDKILQNANYHPSCDLNPIISCGSVMQSMQSHIFSFSNAFIGLAAFGSLLTVGMAIKAGGIFKRWFWLGLELGTIFGLLMVHWLFFETVYRIHALCPYCIAVWIVTITTFWYVTLYNIDHRHIILPKKLGPAYKWIRSHHIDLLVLWIIIIAALILKHFWYYYGHYF
jgi:uncharacterized membrane protein